jgi:PAS domain-containing protein
MSEGVGLHEVIYNEEGKPTDYRILDVNPAYVTITGISREEAIGSLASTVYGTGSPLFLEEYAKVCRYRRSAFIRSILGTDEQTLQHIGLFRLPRASLRQFLKTLLSARGPRSYCALDWL